MRVPAAHEATTGSERVIVALIDLEYRHHPDLDGHLWTNLRPTKGDEHGWDFMDDDATLRYTGPNEDAPYFRNHHMFVGAVAPRCPIMILRVGYQRNHGSWARAGCYTVEHGARVIVMPHGSIRRAPGGDVPLVYQGPTSPTRKTTSGCCPEPYITRRPPRQFGPTRSRGLPPFRAMLRSVGRTRMRTA